MNNDVVGNLLILENLANNANLIEDNYVRNCLQWLSIKWNQLLANSLYQYLIDVQNGDYFCLDIFELPANQEEIDGQLKLGKVLGKEEIQFNHKINRLPLHILAGGTSGSGKTNFAKILIEQAYNAKVDTIKISDPKSEYSEIAIKFPEFILFRWNELRFNPLIPPPNVPENEWCQSIVGHMAQCFNFWEGSQSLLLRLISNLTYKGNNPTLYDLLIAVEEEKPRFKQKDLMIMSTVASRLELMINTLRAVVLTKSSILPELTNRHYILQTTGLMSEIESWLLEFILLWDFMYRVFNEGERKLSLRIYDECQHRLFSSEKERVIKKISSSMISMLVDEVRAFNIGICALSQEPSVLLKSVLNNSYLKISFHLGSGAEVKVMKNAMGLNHDQAESLFYLETGEAIVRMAGGYMDPFPVKINEFLSPTVSDEAEFRQHQAKLKKELYDNAGIVENIGGKDFKRTRVSGEDDDFNEDYDVIG